MTRWFFTPACLAIVASAAAVAADAPETGDDNATTLPPVVVHPAPNPLGDPLAKLRETLPDLGYQPRKKRSRLAEDLNQGTGFERQFYTQVLNEDPRLDGPPPPYITEGDGELAKRVDEAFESAQRAGRK